MRKMLKEIETEEIRVFCHIFVIDDISIGGPGPPAPPLGTPMDGVEKLLY